MSTDLTLSDNSFTANLDKAQPETAISSGGDVIDEEEDDMEYIELPDDVYSMLFIANWRSFAFWYAFFVFTLQLLILFLVGWDLLKDYPNEQDENKLNVPAIVDFWQVAAAQGLAILIAVVNQDDITITLILVAVGISPPFRKALPSLQGKYPGGATQFQFWLANFLRLSEGLLVVVVSFFFIVQADNVLDIFLNFAAIEFVAELDNLGHRIAAEGWIGNPIKDLAKNLKDTTLPAKKAQQKWTCNVNRILLLVLLLVLYVCWGVLERWQTLGQFLEQNACKTLRIGFGDEVSVLLTVGHKV